MFTKKIDYLNEAQFLEQIEHYRLFSESIGFLVKIPQLCGFDIDSKTCDFEKVNCDVSLLQEYADFLLDRKKIKVIENWFGTVSDIIELNLTKGIIHSDLVLHNIFIDQDQLILIDCFPPCDLPNRLDYLSSKDESCGFLFNIISNSKIFSYKNFIKNKQLVRIIYNKNILDMLTIQDLMLGSYRSALDYFRIKSKHHSIIKSIIKSILFSIITFGLLIHEKYISY